ncbi:iron ABC transporter ATPase [Moraxella macacae 0408225]|uniref:Iron ABC transporter ATPase n=1 Tax=Moraxella macacae 0408225 TaxID=1230338 RepID=L2FBD6_9GAMM|nr:ABC transporter ATP-binding protein [Moraxella macacae]ELA09753.1 iron ABC transporter ATPase [Moraxella macacae 0408225]
MLNVTDLSVEFDKRPILTNFNFNLLDGEIACLLGASGCGKTTALRCVAGFLTPNRGKIVLNDRPLFDAKINLPAHKRHIGMVFQDYALFPHLTVADNIGFGLHGFSKTVKQQRIDEMLSFIGLTSHKKHYPHELSGGQQQRIALARALAPRPKLILLDEPFSNLDTDLRTHLSKEIRQLLKQEQVSAIMVTHDQQEAFAMADKIGVVNEGKIQQWDKPQNLYHYPANRFVAKFIGQGTLLDTTQLTEQFCQMLMTQSQLVQSQLPTQALWLIRPDDVVLSTQNTSNGMPCVIKDKEYKGDHYLYQVQPKLPNDTNLLLVKTDLHTDYACGQTVFAVINNIVGVE